MALDGLQPDVGHEVLWVLRDCLSGEVLLARSLLSATQEDLAALLREVKQALTVPIVGVISDGQLSIRAAVAEALPQVPPLTLSDGGDIDAPYDTPTSPNPHADLAACCASLSLLW